MNKQTMPHLHPMVIRSIILTLSLSLHACYSLPSSPYCYSSYDSISIEQIKRDQFNLCCTTTQDCTIALKTHFTQEGTEETEVIELREVINKVECPHQVCSYKTESNDMNRSRSCEDGSDCPNAQFCILGYCETDPYADQDFDGVPTDVDNCPDISNAQQNDCDDNGVGDACDPAGPCQGSLIGQTTPFIDGRFELPIPCLHIELEGENIRVRANEQGSYNMTLPKLSGERRVLGFIGAGLDSAGVNCSSFDGLHGSVFSNVPIFEQRITFDNNQGEAMSRDLAFAPRGALHGRVLKADQHPMNGTHNGIRVRLLGLSRRATITNHLGYFKFEGLEPSTQYTIAVSSEGYDRERFNDITVKEGQTTQLFSGEQIVVTTDEEQPSLQTEGRCRVSLTQMTCNDDDSDDCGTICGGSGDLPSSCFDGLICVPNAWGEGLSLQPQEVSQMIEKEVVIEVKILNMPKDKSSKYLSLTPRLVISSVLSGHTNHIELLEGEEEVIVQENLPDIYYQTYRWRGSLAQDDLYNVVAIAGDPTRLLTARQLHFALDTNPEREGPAMIQLNIAPRRSVELGQWDEDQDGILDINDLDQDGDGTLDEFDSDPRNPYQALEVLESCQSSAEQCTDDDNDGLSDTEELTFGADGQLSSPISNEMTSPLGIQVTSGLMNRISGMRLAPNHWRLAYQESKLANLNGTPIRFNVAPRASDDQAPLNVMLKIPIKVPLELAIAYRRSAIGEQAFLLIDEACPIALSDPMASIECLANILIVQAESCDPLNGLPYTNCTIEFTLDDLEQPFTEEKHLSIWPIKNFVSLIQAPEERILRPICDQICLSDTHQSQPLYGLIRRSFAQNELGSCLSSSIADEAPLSRRPLLLRELIAQCAPLSLGEEDWRTDHCQVEPLRDNRGVVYVLTKIIAQEWPDDCTEVNEALLVSGEDPVLVATETCREAIKISGATLTVQLDNGAGERSIIEYQVQVGDELGRCLP